MKGTSKTVLKRNYHTLVEQGRATRFGPQWKGIRCGAKTRRGTPCLKPAIKTKARCQLHGGRSTGARTPEGLQKLKDIHYLVAAWNVNIAVYIVSTSVTDALNC